MVRLVEIDQVDWSAKTCGCGNAAHVPVALYGLCSADLEGAEQAYWNLENHVVVQSELFTAAEPIPAIVVALWPHVKFKAMLANLLYQIGSATLGYTDPTSVRYLDQVLAAYQAIFTREKLDPDWRAAMQADYQDLADARLDS